MPGKESPELRENASRSVLEREAFALVYARDPGIFSCRGKCVAIPENCGIIKRKQCFSALQNLKK